MENEGRIQVNTGVINPTLPTQETSPFVAKTSRQALWKRFYRNNMFWILLCAFLGVALGVGLSYTEFDTIHEKVESFWDSPEAQNQIRREVISWIELPGKMFLRALTLFVVPLIFFNIITSTVEMLNAGNAVAIGWKTIILYTFTTVIASLIGISTILCFKDQFSIRTFHEEFTSLGTRIQCPPPDETPYSLAADKHYLQYDSSQDRLICVAGDDGQKPPVLASQFILDNQNGGLETVNKGEIHAIGISEQLQKGVFYKTLSNNIFMSLATMDFLGIIVFAILFAVALQNVKLKAIKRHNDELPRKLDDMIGYLSALTEVFAQLLRMVTLCTPVAVFSLIAAALGEIRQDELGNQFKDIGFFVTACLIGSLMQTCIVYPVLYFAITRQSPFHYMSFLFPAQILAFSSASSASTLPETMKCVSASKMVPKSVRNFVLAIGSTVNMDGGGVYFPPAIVFLAVSSGSGDGLNAGAYILILIMSTLGSGGAAPIPHASLAMIATIYNTVMGQTGEPRNFGYILAVDWLLDRVRTTVNVTGDAMVAGMVGHLERGDETIIDDMGYDDELSDDYVDEEDLQKGKLDV